MDFTGASDIEKILDNLPLKMQAKILKAINVEGAKIVQKEIIRSAPSGSEIPESIILVGDKENTTGVYVTPDGRTAYYVRWLEYGTVKRQTDKKFNRGVMNPQPFVKSAIDRSTPQALEYITKNYAELVNKYLTKEVKTINRKNKKNGL
ncbi:HK97-gp10 family putative phage morphogenesis protein [Rufibacter sp. LB8]|nr:HK97-gp10 family putative phage morphogenesis protein [Rufibacter sp. LB8]